MGFDTDIECFPYYFSNLFFKTESLSFQLNRVVSKALDPSVFASASLSIGLQRYIIAPGFLHRCWGFTLRSSCMHSKRTLSTEPSSRPREHLNCGVKPSIKWVIDYKTYWKLAFEINEIVRLLKMHNVPC